MAFRNSVLPFRHRALDTVFVLARDDHVDVRHLPVYTRDGRVIAWRDKATCEKAAAVIGGCPRPKTRREAQDIASSMKFSLVVMDDEPA
jgi:hypothetical protein